MEFVGDAVDDMSRFTYISVAEHLVAPQRFDTMVVASVPEEAWMALLEAMLSGDSAVVCADVPGRRAAFSEPEGSISQETRRA